MKLSRSMLTELKYTLNEFIARRGTPRTIISDNAKTFKDASNWLKTIVHDENFSIYIGLNGHLTCREHYGGKDFLKD